MVWSAPPACPDLAQLRGQILRYVGAPSAQARAATTVRASVRATDDDQWSAEVVIVDPQRIERRLHAPSCALLTRAIALMVAVRVEPVRVGERMTTPSPRPNVVPVQGRASTQTTTPKTRATERPAPSSPRDSAASVTTPTFGRRGLLGIGGSAAAGMGPRVAGAVSATGGVEGTRWRVEAEGSYWPTTPFEGVRPGVATGELLLMTLAVRGCGVAPGRRWRVPMCAGVRGGAVRGIGRGRISRPVPAWAPWLDLVVEPSVVWIPRPWVGLRAGVGGAVALARSEFAVGPGHSDLVVLRIPAANARAFVGIELYFSARNGSGTGTQ